KENCTLVLRSNELNFKTLKVDGESVQVQVPSEALDKVKVPLLPALSAILEAEGLKRGTPLYVALGFEIAKRVNATLSEEIKPGEIEKALNEAVFNVIDRVTKK